MAHIRFSTLLLIVVVALSCKSKDKNGEADKAAANETRSEPDDKAEEEKLDDDESGGTGTAMALEEGKMGKNDSARSSGQFQMKKVASSDKEQGPGTDKAKKAKKTWKRSTLVANTSRLMIGDREHLPIKGMQVRAKVDGFRARVLIDFYFYNDRDRQYEGTFKLRLPQGASPYFLAFGQSKFAARPDREKPEYVQASQVRKRSYEPVQIMQERAASWIQPKEARMVPKKKAARAYTETVRRRVDPALMEWAGAGVFNARVFPIAPKRLHRIVVGYDMDLTRIGEDLELLLPIPKDLPSSAVDLDVAVLGGVDVNVSPAAPGSKDGQRAYYRLANHRGGAIKVRLSKVRTVALVGGDASGSSMFAARLKSDIPASAARGVPDGVFLVDVSMSSNPDRFNVWLSLLRSILDNNRGRLKRFAVLFFNVESFWWQQRMVDNTPANVASLIKYANNLALEGATDIGAALAAAARPSWASDPGRRNLFVLSDGAVTWGEGNAYALSNRLERSGVAALFAYRTGMSGDDARMLRHLAREAGGAVFSVVGESEVKAASVAHTATPWTIAGIKLAGASDIMIAGRPRALFPGQRLLVVGRGNPAKGAKIVLSLTQGTERKTVSVPLHHVVRSPLAPRVYGQLAVGQLEELLGSTRSFAEAYARHFRVTGKSTSLLMLESEADYLRFGIVPKNDAGLVAQKPASKVIATALVELAKVLGDAKFAFLKNDKLSDSLRTLLQQIPGSAFEVAVPALVARDHGRGKLGPGLSTQLTRRKPQYDTVVSAAKARLKRFTPVDGLVALSSLVEANPGDGVLARDVGFTAMQWGLHAHAYHLFRRVAEARPYEPQTFRALAKVLAALKRFDLALAYFEIATTGTWDGRFGQFRRIVMMDYIRFLGRNATKLSPKLHNLAGRRIAELRKELGIKSADIVVTITWNTDSTDIDLHVMEPSGEDCYYSNRDTRSGGHMTEDVTQGYGPEMYHIKSAPRGQYKVRAKYFASNQNRASARTKVYATIVRNWGRKNETVTNKVVTLAYGKEMHDIVTIKK